MDRQTAGQACTHAQDLDPGHKCVEAAPAANAGVADADNGAQSAASPLSLPQLNLLPKQRGLSEEEIG